MSQSRSFRRHRLGAVVLAAAVGLGATLPAAAAEVVRIGYQKYGTLVILKARGALERRLEPLGIEVRWTEFPAGPQLLEALNIGSLDFGTVGEAPPVFAQAAGADLVYVAHEPPAPAAEALLVPKDSPVRSVADLKGQRVALNKGSNVHYLLVRALEEAGLTVADIQPVYLPPADARAAFERGAVAAWAIWDPYFAAAQTQLEARVLRDGSGLVSNHQFYLAARPYAQQHPQIVGAIVEELRTVDAWGKAHPEEVARFLAPAVGLDEATVLVAARRYSYGAEWLTPAVAAEQQKIADAFSALRLIPKPIRIADALWTPPATVAAEAAAPAAALAR